MIANGSPLSAHRNSAYMGNDWQWITDPLNDWVNEASSMAALAWALVQTDPHARAMLQARLLLTHGSEGLRFRSNYQSDDSLESTDQERSAQRLLTETVAKSWDGCWIDAGRQMTRLELEQQIDTAAIVAGDGFAVRVIMPGRPACDYATAWRVIAPERVCNPFGVPDWKEPGIPDIGEAPPAGAVVWQGIELDANGQPSAIWVAMPVKSEPWRAARPQMMRVPYWSPDGTRNVIHKFRSLRAGQLRGFSEFAPIFFHCQQLKGTTEAHTVAKRAQACHPMIQRTNDPEALRMAQKSNSIFGPNLRMRPGMVAVTGHDSEVIFPNWTYSGSDYQAHLDASIRSIAASWGLPWQFVMAQLTNANLASSRAALDQAERVARGWQNSHIHQVTGLIDRSVIAEAFAMRELPGLDQSKSSRGQYLRPRTWSTDKLKEAQAAQAWASVGLSYTTIYSQQGWDFEAETSQRRQDDEYLRGQGVMPDQQEDSGREQEDSDEEDEDEEEDEENTDED